MTDTHTVSNTSKLSDVQPGRTRARRSISIVVTLLLSTGGVVLLAAAGVLLTGILVAPQGVERVYGEVKTTVDGTIEQVKEERLGVLPTVKLGATGGLEALHRCDGTFTEMISYEYEGVPPVWAAHNNCAGDVLLAWQIGQQIRIDGSDQIYEVVDIRQTPKNWATTDDLVGLGGALALQTCYYGENRMKFVGLEPIG